MLSPLEERSEKLRRALISTETRLLQNVSRDRSSLDELMHYLRTELAKVESHRMSKLNMQG